MASNCEATQSDYNVKATPRPDLDQDIEGTATNAPRGIRRGHRHLRPLTDSTAQAWQAARRLVFGASGYIGTKLVRPDARSVKESPPAPFAASATKLKGPAATQ